MIILKDIKVVKSADIQRHLSGPGRPQRWPFYEMDINNYFEFDESDYYKVIAAAGMHAKKHNKKFHTSKITCRCTRVL